MYIELCFTLTNSVKLGILMDSFRTVLRSVRPETRCIRLVSTKSARKTPQNGQLMKNNASKHSVRPLSSADFLRYINVMHYQPSVIQQSDCHSGWQVSPVRTRTANRFSRFESEGVRFPVRRHGSVPRASCQNLTRVKKILFSINFPRQFG